MAISTSRILLCLAIAALSSAVLGQSSFDVSSVKRHDPADRTFSPPACTNNRFTVRTLPVAELLTWAYDLRYDQFLALEPSLPDWARMEPYDIEAAADKPLAEARCKLMVQQMLSDRFKMKSHWKTITNAPGYELRVAPKGHKLQPVSTTDVGCGVHISFRGQERPCDRYQFPMAPKRAMSMKELAQVLSNYTSREPIRDMTGLSGEYKINLSFALRSDDPQYPSMETALQEQLGLVMRRTSGDSEVLVVDSIERPTAN